MLFLYLHLATIITTTTPLTNNSYPPHPQPDHQTPPTKQHPHTTPKMHPLLLLPLLTPLLLSHPTPAPQRDLLPRAATESACSVAVRTGFTWTAADFTYSLPPVAVAFTLTNSALDYTHSCTGQATTASPFDGTYWFECSGEKGSASFSFDLGSGRVGVRQGWECDNGAKGRYVVLLIPPGGRAGDGD